MKFRIIAENLRTGSKHAFCSLGGRQWFSMRRTNLIENYYNLNGADQVVVELNGKNEVLFAGNGASMDIRNTLGYEFTKEALVT